VDVVKKFYRFTCCYSVIHKSGHTMILMMSCITQHFTIHIGTIYYRETFRCRLTADSRLHIAMDCRRGTLVKLCGLTRIKFYDLHTSVDGDTTSASEPHSQPTSSLIGHP